MNSADGIQVSKEDSGDLEIPIVHDRAQELIINRYESNKEEIDLRNVKIFEKVFFIKILERQSFAENDVIDYILMYEINPENTELEEVEDKNWFDDDNLFAKSGAVSMLELPDVLQFRGPLRTKGNPTADVSAGDNPTNLSQSAGSKEDRKSVV